MHTRSLSRAIAFAIAAPAALWLGCGGGADLTGPPAGSLQVTVATTGAEPDPDGYAVSLDGGTARAVGVNETLLLEGLSAGTHALDLSGLAANCSPTGGSHVDVEVTANATAAASFAIACGATSGAVSVRTVTTGEPADPDGYELTLDGGAPQPIGSAATLTLPSVAPGAHSLALGGLASNCAVSSDNPVGVTVSAGSTSEVTIDVTCAPTSPPPAPGSLSVTTRTTGPDQDADGYSVTLDGDPGLPIGVSASLAVSDLAPGAHMVGLTGISANCRLDDDNPRIVEVASGTVTPVTFAITCAALPPSIGSLELTTATTGATPDPDGYTFEIDNGDPQPIGVNATVTVASLAAGSHAVRLRGASANCTIAGDNPRGVTVEAGGVARLTFSIACAVATGSLRITTTSSGAPADPDGYTVSVDGGAPQPIGNAATLTIDGLEPRTHSVQLAGLAANCQAQGGNPRSVSVAPGETAATTFSVTCSATTGTLEITVTGLPAGASAAVGVTGPDKFSTAVTGTTSLDDLAPGSYTVTSNDVSANGTTYSATPASQTLTVAANATSRVTVTYGALAGRTLNLRIDGVELTQSVQQPGGTVPLVADRDGFLRVFVLANETNTAAPSVRVRLSRDGRVVQTLTITAPRGSTPTARDEGDLNASWNVKIPRSMFTAGLAIQAEVDPDNSVAESNESDNAFPASGAARQTVRSVPEFALRFVPVRQQVSGAQGAISEGTRADFLRLTRRMYPIASVDGDVHAVYTTSTTDALQSDDANDAWTTILNEVDALRVADGCTHLAACRRARLRIRITPTRAGSRASTVSTCRTTCSGVPRRRT